MRSETIKVTGMTCGHCVETVKKAVTDAGSVSHVDVDLDKKRVSVNFDDNTTDLESIIKKIVEAGYEVER